MIKFFKKLLGMNRTVAIFNQSAYDTAFKLWEQERSEWEKTTAAGRVKATHEEYENILRGIKCLRKEREILGFGGRTFFDHTLAKLEDALVDAYKKREDANNEFNKVGGDLYGPVGPKMDDFYTFREE